MNIVHQPPELLAPAGNWECARAAVANGADAIYFGLPRFNARLRADNFSETDLPELMRFLHDHGLRGFVAMNTLIFTNELMDAERELALCQESGVDALIIQDLGLARMAKIVAPDVELHASTQMTLTSPEGLAFAMQLGIDQAVLARELSLRELERFKGTTVPLEVFVHGALCVAYSGQCLTSESLGQRSANRGECAQACRMPYQLVVDGVPRDLGDRRYLLSPQDLAALDEIPRLIELGIRCFKIEGRLKSPEYVAAVTRAYRKAIDAALSGTPPADASGDRYALEMTFSRGLFSGWMHGVDHQKLVGARFGKKRGPFVGHITKLHRDAVEIDHFATPLQPGDGVVFDTGEDTNHEQGGFLFKVAGNRLEFQNGKIDTRKLRPGDRVWKTSDPALDKRLRASFKGTLPVRKRHALYLLASGSAGQPLHLEVKDAQGNSLTTLTSAQPLQVAENRPLTPAVLAEQFGRLGGTLFFLESVTAELDGPVMLSLSELGRMRKDMLEKLSARFKKQCGAPPARTGVAAEMLAALKQSRGTRKAPALGETPELTVLCRTMAQLQTAAEAGIGTLYADFEDIRLYDDATAWVKANAAPDTQIFLATPRIQKAGEQGFFKLIERCAPHGVLVRNLGAISHFAAAGLPMIGDFSLNTANPITAEFLMGQGFQRLTISYDLNIEQVLAMLENAPTEWFEITLHQHMPMFHMEHCVFAAFLSNGSSFLDCGRPCEKHSVKLRDRVGMEHPLRADVGCRNTLFNAVPQTGAKFYETLRATGLRWFRVELLDESTEDVRRILAAYRELLSGNTGGESLWRELRAQSQLGVTAGTLREGALA